MRVRVMKKLLPPEIVQEAAGEIVAASVGEADSESLTINLAPQAQAEEQPWTLSRSPKSNMAQIAAMWQQDVAAKQQKSVNLNLNVVRIS